MRRLISKGATIAIIVMASGAAAGQTQSSPSTDVPIMPLPKHPPPLPRVLHQTAVVERLLSFDANGDDRIARDELPERMEGLVSRGDKNQDGFLTPDEVIALVDTPSAAQRIQGFTVPRAATAAEIIADLKLPAATHARAMEIVKEHTVSRNSNGDVSKELDAAMRKLLDDQDYENFVAAAARHRNSRFVVIR